MSTRYYAEPQIAWSPGPAQPAARPVAAATEALPEGDGDGIAFTAPSVTEKCRVGAFATQRAGSEEAAPVGHSRAIKDHPLQKPVLSGVKPYFEKDGITLYCGDCLEVMRSLVDASIGCVLTDPPYCSGGSLEAQKNTKAQGLRSATVASADFVWFAADNMGTAGLTFLLRSVLLEARRLLLPNRSAFVFTDWRMVPNLAPALESSGLRYRNLLVWDKQNAGLGVGFKPAHELVMEFTNGVTEYQAQNGQNVLRVPRVHASEKEHGAQKPVALLSKILQVACPAGETVIDPFMGSGSTIDAARDLGYRAIGIDLSERNCEIAARRLSQQLLPFAAPTQPERSAP